MALTTLRGGKYMLVICIFRLLIKFLGVLAIAPLCLKKKRNSHIPKYLAILPRRKKKEGKKDFMNHLHTKFEVFVILHLYALFSVKFPTNNISSKTNRSGFSWSFESCSGLWQNLD